MNGEKELHARAFAALQDLRAAARSGSDASHGRRIPASRIIAYARRANSMADLHLERAMRREPGLQALYRRALSSVACASSTRAAAASAARVTRRPVGDHIIEIVTEADGMPWLVLRLAENSAPVTMMELRGPGGVGRRVELAEPIDGVVQLPLDPSFPELSGVAELIGDPLTEIYLL